MTSTVSPRRSSGRSTCRIQERMRRMRALRRVVAGRDVFSWASDILDQFGEVQDDQSLMSPWPAAVAQPKIVRRLVSARRMSAADVRLAAEAIEARRGRPPSAPPLRFRRHAVRVRSRPATRSSCRASAPALLDRIAEGATVAHRQRPAARRCARRAGCRRRRGTPACTAWKSPGRASAFRTPALRTPPR